MKIQMNSDVVELIKSLSDKIYVVGGYTRNSLLGYPTTDIDVSGPYPAAVLKLPPKATLKMINHRMGTAQISYGDIKLEYTPFRLEVYNPGGEHRPTEVYFTDDLRADASRRDFCCNAIYYDVNEDEIIDPLNGLKDIELKVLRGCNKHVFESDGLRLLRLVRFASELNFKIETQTALSAKANSELLKDIVHPRKKAELDKMLLADMPYGAANGHYRAMRLLKQLDLWKHLIPEIAAMDGVVQNAEYHKYDVMEHTFQTVRFAPPEVRHAALFHDVGKPFCVARFGNMHGHEHNGDIMTRAIMSRLCYPEDFISEVATLVSLHMFDMRGDVKDTKMRLFVAENFMIIDKLAALCRADALATGMSVDLPPQHRFIQVKNQLIESNAPILKKRLRINGDDLVELKYPEKEIGACLDELWRQCIIEPKFNTREYLIERVKRKLDAIKLKEPKYYEIS